MNKLLDFARSQKNLNINGKLLEGDERLIEREVSFFSKRSFDKN